MKNFNEWKIFNKSEYDLLKELDYNGYSKIGYVYLLEYGDYIKIGTTKEPYNRIRSLVALGRDYAEVTTGKVAISPKHINRNENEKKLHEMFSQERVENGELFKVPLNSALEKIKTNPITYIVEENDAPQIDAEKFFTKVFIGSKYDAPKGKTRFPMYSCWEEEFEDKLFVLSLKIGKQKAILREEVISFVKSVSFFDDYKEIYKKDMDCTDFDAIGMIEYFPELARMADAYLDKLEEVTERQIKNS